LTMKAQAEMKSKKTSANREQVARDYNVPNLVRAFQLLEFMAREPQGWSITELSDRLGFPKNSVFRICRSLHEMGYLTQTGKTYFLSPKLLALGYAALGEQNLVEKALDIMRDLRDELNETTLFGTLFGHEGVTLEQVVSNQSIKFVVDVGHRFALHTAAPGKAMLAFLPERERDHILDQLDFKKYTSNTITSRKSYLPLLQEVRDKGWAVDNCERLDGINCVAAPVFNFRNMPIAAVWVTGPDFRMPPSSFSRIGKIVQRHALRISQRFGYEPGLRNSRDGPLGGDGE
jgi:DNA-binding IclR family transcriptional regulator